MKLVLLYGISMRKPRNNNANVTKLVIYTSHRMSNDYASVGLNIKKRINHFAVKFLRITRWRIKNINDFDIGSLISILNFTA